MPIWRSDTPSRPCWPYRRSAVSNSRRALFGNSFDRRAGWGTFFIIADRTLECVLAPAIIAFPFAEVCTGPPTYEIPSLVKSSDLHAEAERRIRVRHLTW